MYSQLIERKAERQGPFMTLSTKKIYSPAWDPRVIVFQTAAGTTRQFAPPTPWRLTLRNQFWLGATPPSDRLVKAPHR